MSPLVLCSIPLYSAVPPRYAHSIVPGGLLVTSQVTRLMLVTSFTMQFPADLRFTSITTLSKPLSLHVRPVWARTVGSTR